MKIRVTALLITFILVLSSVSVGALAMNTVQDGGVDSAEMLGTLPSQAEIEEINQMLSFIGYEADSYGMGNVDFETLSIGQRINAYEFSNGELIPLTINYYPLFAEDDLCALVLTNNDGAAGFRVQISVSLAEELVDVGCVGDSFAIIYDANHMYVSNQEELKTIHSFESTRSLGELSRGLGTTNRGSLTEDNCTQISNISYSNLSATGNYKLAFTPNTSQAYYSLSVDIINQASNSSYCWACAIASIGNYLTSISKTGVEIARAYYGSSYNRSLSMGAAISFLNEYYDLEYDSEGVAASQDLIRDAIDDGYPIYGRFRVGESSTDMHATVIRGVDTTRGYISLMDPEVSYYVTATLCWDGSVLAYQYDSPASGNTLTLNGHGFPEYLLD